jgi:hypothetical protein
MRGRGEVRGRNINIPYLDVIRVSFCCFGSDSDKDRFRLDRDAECIIDGVLDEVF